MHKDLTVFLHWRWWLLVIIVLLAGLYVPSGSVVQLLGLTGIPSIAAVLRLRQGIHWERTQRDTGESSFPMDLSQKIVMAFVLPSLLLVVLYLTPALILNEHRIALMAFITSVLPALVWPLTWVMVCLWRPTFRPWATVILAQTSILLFFTFQPQAEDMVNTLSTLALDLVLNTYRILAGIGLAWSMWILRGPLARLTQIDIAKAGWRSF
ncbi:MAG: hypothetical protein JNM31_02350 [Flavobacteriales bacterium]|nr:hypothetical protein [Flavobacteriales bacterium]